jgi:hypothetical protein
MVPLRVARLFGALCVEEAGAKKATPARNRQRPTANANH